MANKEHYDILVRGVEMWNRWRGQAAQAHTYIRPDLHAANFSGAILSHAALYNANLSYADLYDADLSGADLSGANLDYAHLNGANLSYALLNGASFNEANLSRASFSAADLSYADLSGANLSGANLSDAHLTGADLSGADLSGADLSGADLSRATLVETKFAEATLTNCHIYGISAWSLELKGAIQNNLVITPAEEPTITVDNLEVAQFIYLLLNNPKIRDVIDTIARRAVLILGRFTPSRKAVLDALREALRAQGYVPILFDFDKPSSRDLTETISTLAHLARFVIADITDAKSIPQELMIVVPNLPSVPVLPLILNAQHEYGMFEHFTRFPWVLPVYRYTDEGSLLQSLKENIIEPAEQKAQELAKR